MLVLPIKKKWFDMIKSGEKKEEYREIKPYYTSRFFNNYIKNGVDLDYILNNNIEIYRDIIFRNGYRNNSPQIICYCHIFKGYGKEEWGAEKRKGILCFKNKKYYILEILKINNN